MPSSKAAKSKVAKKKAPAKKKAAAKKSDQLVDNVSEENVVTIDRRNEERRVGDAEALDLGVMKSPRRKKQRRRHIDPTTCERDYNAEEIEFMRAMDDYKQASGRMFPTCSEVLEVVRGLGYYRLNDEQRELLQIAPATEEGDETMSDYDAEESELESALEV